MAVELTLPTISPQAMTLESIGPITLVLGSVISIAPTITTNPTISGTAKVGETLTATAGDTTGTPPPTSTFQWQRSDNGISGWSDISGATGTTYVLISADETKYLRVEQTATNIEGSVTATSASTSQVQPAFTGLLDTYSGAAAAYSLRLLRGGYNGSAIRVRRSDDNEEQDIGFRNNDLDTSALTTFCGSSDGFVVTWFDQSGNGNNATQSTASAQPKIVSSGSTILENNKATIDYAFANVHLTTELTIGTSQTNWGWFGAISSGSNISSNNCVYGGRTSSGNGAIAFIGSNKLNVRTDGTSSISGTITTNTQFLASQIQNETSHDAYLNGSSIGTAESVAMTNTTNPIKMGVLAYTDALFFYGKMQEMIFYKIDQSSNRTGIETNINDHYSIYE